MNVPLVIVIPTLNAAPLLGRTLASVRDAAAGIVIADGGSVDGTRDLAGAAGARVVTAPRGRGPQLAAGALAAIAAGADWLLFLHADTVLPPGWAEEANAFIADPVNATRAAAFRFALDDRSQAARGLERIVAWRCRALGLPYGDQGLLIARAFYESLGGFRPIPLYEDVDLVRRIGRRRLVLLDACAVTSARRYRQGGYLLRPLRNLFCLGLYFARVPPRLIARLYG
jgi:rSAM/selenodomain-associated transferase 2